MTSRSSQPSDRDVAKTRFDLDRGRSTIKLDKDASVMDMLERLDSACNRQ